MSPAATLGAPEAEAAALKAADELFYTRGIASVTMAQIRDRSGVSLRRLYSLYPSKSDLVTGWLEFRHHRWMADFTGRVEAGLRNGADPVDAIFTAVDQWMTATDFRGCGFINTHAESSELTEAHRQIIRMHKRSLADYLQTLSPRGAALAIMVDGAIIQASIFGKAEPIGIARQAAATLHQETWSSP